MSASNSDLEREIPNVVEQLLGLVASKEQALKDREEELARRSRLFEEEFPDAGNDRDVLHLNVGGATNVAVLRRTLTHFPHSMLAARFSGRWDDSIEKDKDGNFFIDADPAVFMPLLNYLRNWDKKKRNDIDVPPPAPTFDFCWLLEYYDLMTAVYPQTWLWRDGNETKRNIQPPDLSPSPFVLSSGNSSMKTFWLDLDAKGYTKPALATAVTIEFERGSTGQIGWTIGALSDGAKVGYATGQVSLDLECNRFMKDGVESRANLDVSVRENSVKVRCTYNQTQNVYYIKVEDADPPIEMECITRGRMFPVISFTGKVIVTGLSYGY